MSAPAKVTHITAETTLLVRTLRAVINATATLAMLSVMTNEAV